MTAGSLSLLAALFAAVDASPMADAPVADVDCPWTLRAPALPVVATGAPEMALTTR